MLHAGFLGCGPEDRGCRQAAVQTAMGGTYSHSVKQNIIFFKNFDLHETQSDTASRRHVSGTQNLPLTTITGGTRYPGTGKPSGELPVQYYCSARTRHCERQSVFQCVQAWVCNRGLECDESTVCTATHMSIHHELEQQIPKL